jgi:hypothetical protein
MIHLILAAALFFFVVQVLSFAFDRPRQPEARGLCRSCGHSCKAEVSDCPLRHGVES